MIGEDAHGYQAWVPDGVHRTDKTFVLEWDVFAGWTVVCERMRRAALRCAVDDALAVLPPRDRAVVIGSFGWNGEQKTLQAIGDELGLSRERVRGLRNRAVRRLARVVRRCGYESEFADWATREGDRLRREAEQEKRQRAKWERERLAREVEAEKVREETRKKRAITVLEHRYRVELDRYWQALDNPRSNVDPEVYRARASAAWAAVVARGGG